MCANEEIADGVMRAAAASGTRVPDDVIVTGWDDTAMAARIHPPLTTVRQPMHELGRRAARLLFDRVDGQASTSVVLRTTLVVREGCGCTTHRTPVKGVNQ
jgi:LacI family transcriptional regulator